MPAVDEPLGTSRDPPAWCRSAGVTIILCLGSTPDTWWQAKNWIGRQVLDRAERLAPDEASRKAIFEGQLFQSLNLFDIASPLRERVWTAVEAAAREISIEA